jgi:hypothetical protein
MLQKNPLTHLHNPPKIENLRVEKPNLKFTEKAKIDVQKEIKIIFGDEKV